MITFVNSWTFLNNQGNPVTSSPVINGLKTSLKALKLLCEIVITQKGFHWFATRRCTQDHLEVIMHILYTYRYCFDQSVVIPDIKLQNVFSQVRIKNGHNSHPNVEQFEHAIRSVALENMSASKLSPATANNTNCKPELEEAVAFVDELKSETIF